MQLTLTTRKNGKHYAFSISAVESGQRDILK